jgi:RHS repeat-associated protein
MKGTTCCEQDASLAIIRRALRFERIVANAGVPTTTYTYDANGNVVQTGGWTYVWDYLNRMLASGYNNSTTTYGYDTTGARVLQVSTTSTTYYPSKYFSLASTTIGGTSYATSTNYIWLGDTLLSTIDQKLNNGTATGTAITRYVHPDHLGSTNVVTDASGAIAQLLDYYPYGATRVSSSSYPTNEKRQYIGQYSDTGTGLSYLNARYYNPQQGQFISQDPTFWGSKQNLKDPQSFNAYSYAENNPVTLKDPFGLAATVAQQIAVLQAQVNILQGIISLYTRGFTQQANNVYTAYQTAFGGGGSSQSQTTQPGASAPTSSIAPSSNPTACYTYSPNVSGPLNNAMQSHSADPLINNPLYFRNKVKNGGDWDLKQKPEYSPKAYPNGFVYDGKQVPSDAPGNIHYGYVGAAAAWSDPELLGPGVLLQQAGAAQQAAGTSQPQWQNSNFYGDDPVDQVYILWGINMYYNR